jgi:DNA modification methylase/predicted nucleic acid-binding protein
MGDDAASTEPAAEWVAIAELRPWANNPRKNDKAVERVADSIRRFGFGAPVLARRSDHEVIAGHTRIKAALKLGLARVPVRYLDLDATDAHLLALADNKTTELADWDEDILGALLLELQDKNIDVTTGTGFTDADVEKLIRAVHGDVGTLEDDVPTATDELLAKWNVRPGQLWRIGEHRLICGDATKASDAARLFGIEQAKWMWTDPPYGVDYVGKTKDALTIKNDGSSGLGELLGAAFRNADGVLDDGAPIYVCHPAGPISLEFGGQFVAAGWKFHETLVWVKDSMVLGHSDYHYKHEPILYGWKGKNRTWYGDRSQTTVLEIARPKRSELHPTMKPLALVEHCLRNSTKAGDVGYEPFGGSGTTFVAAAQMGRRCYGVEIDPRYCAVILERLAALGLAAATAD